jgi:hypothetical protein
MSKEAEAFIRGLKEMITGPPPLTFVFISGAAFLISLLKDRWLVITGPLLIYSMAAALWRYAEKDILSNYLKWQLEKHAQKDNKEELKRKATLNAIVIYHLVQIALLVGLVLYLANNT